MRSSGIRSYRLGYVLVVLANNVMLAAWAVAGELLDWPANDESKWETVAVSKLPKDVRPENPEDPDLALEKVQIRHADVDGDGKADLIVDTPLGGNGGTCIFIYRLDGKRYREVLREQGGINIPKERGRLEFWSSSGGMEYRRVVYRFDGKQFVELFTDDLKRRDDDRLEVIARRTPEKK